MENFFLLRLVGTFLLLFLIVMIPLILGQRYGIYHNKRSADLKDAPIGTVVGAAFGTLAFLIVFIFQITADRYTDRRDLLLEEVTNIRKTYLQAGLIPEPIRSDTRKLLMEYVDLRINIARDTSKLNYTLSRSQQILDTLWGYAENLAAKDRSSESYSLFTATINDLVDNYNHRVTMTFEYRLPPAILWILFIVVFFSMLTLGYQFGISGKGSLRINIILGFIFVLIMFLIIALDRPETGLAPLNQKPMITLQKQLQVLQSRGNN
jgi:ABC-type multidrug transport system fused ATPase/permease subunit